MCVCVCVCVCVCAEVEAATAFFNRRRLKGPPPFLPLSGGRSPERKKKSYRFLSLPNLDFETYVVPFTYVKFLQKNKRISVKCDIMGDTLTWDHCTVSAWGTVKVFNSSTMILVDEALVTKHPDIIAKS